MGGKICAHVVKIIKPIAITTTCESKWGKRNAKCENLHMFTCALTI